ncbi:ATP synthase subunit I [Aestuariibacter salexigens]|uniref:ATP synthase subunit I n=1 Tax=Aestuariibacter salexigens TaxID=226010 RepID=UPI0004190412|nr:ATP synthase subunit I [Aestuariibacter salexigens]
MKNALAENGRILARKVLLWQAAFGVLGTLVVVLTEGTAVTVSAISGVIISVFPNLVFAHFAFRYAGASQNQMVAKSFGQGAKLKLFLTIILFVVAFKGLNVQAIPLFVTFAITTVAQWAAMLRYRHKH